MDVFISYSTVNEDFSKVVRHALEKAGISVWIDKENIYGGDNFAEKIQEAINSCKCMVVIVSKYSGTSGHVLNEVKNARKNKDISIIPYQIDDDNDNAIIHHLSLIQRINAATDPCSKLDELIENVYRLLGRKNPPEPTHTVQNLKMVKAVKKSLGAASLTIITIELLLICLYFSMNISYYFFILCAAVFFTAVFYFLYQKNKCAFAGCSKKGEKKKTQVTCLKTNKTMMLRLCNCHRHTFDMYQDKKIGTTFFPAVVALLLALIIAASMFFCKIPFSSLVTYNRSSGYEKVQNKPETSQLLGESIISLAKNTVCILNDGTVYFFDNSMYGSTANEWDGVTRLAASATHIIAQRFDGTILSSGDNTFGQCNVEELDISGIEDIEAGKDFTLILSSDGHVYGIGKNEDGQIDVSGTDNVAQISAGEEHSLILKNDGTVTASGCNSYSQCEVTDWTDIVQVNAGKNISIGLKSDGTVVSTAGDIGWTDIVAVSAGDSLVAGLTKKGKVLLAGEQDRIIKEVADWENIIAIDLCGTHIVALKSDYSLIDADVSGVSYVEGNIANAGTMINTDASVLFYRNMLAASRGFALALSDDGFKASEGMPDIELVGFYEIRQIRANSNTVLGLRKDGGVISCSTEDTDIKLSDWEGISMVDLSENHIVGLQNDGKMISAGDNSFGQCDVTELNDIVYISVADTHTVAVRSDGSVAAVGDNSFGQSGVGDWNEIKSAETGLHHTVGIKYDGTVVATGLNDAGQCDVKTWKDIVSVAVGDDFTIGLKRDGSVVTAGHIDISIFDIQNNIVAVDAAGKSYFLLREDGILYDAYK